MATFEVDLDRYGSNARASCLADFLEVLALVGKRCTYAQLADILSDRWGMRRQLVVLPGDEEEVAEEYVDSTWVALRERSSILADLYPFAVSDTEISLKPAFGVHRSGYVGLLALTVAHAFAIDTGINVEQLFERVAAESLKSLGLTVEAFGDISRRNGLNFPLSLEELGRLMNIAVDSGAASRRVHANDAGVDIVAHLDWRDGRIGRWLFLGQATCATSDYWSMKLGEVKTPRWRQYLREETEPIAFLAVPHHVDRRAYFELVEGESKAVVDRPRLARGISQLGAELEQVIAAVLASEIQGVEI